MLELSLYRFSGFVRIITSSFFANATIAKRLHAQMQHLKKRKLLYSILLLSITSFASCNNDQINTLNVAQESVFFEANGGTRSINFETDAGSWTITNSGSDWLTISATEGAGGKNKVTLTVNSRTLEPRTATLVFTAGNSTPVSVEVSQASSDYLYTLSSDLSTINFGIAGGGKSLKITSDAPAWTLSTDADWITFSQDTGNKGSTTITITVSENTGDNARTATITLHADNSEPVQIDVLQKGPLYPGYNISPQAADQTGMSSSAIELASKIKVGWNIGNTLEAIGGETAWGNPKITKSLIDEVKASGFNAVRIPCSWDQYVADHTTAKLKTEWLDRVKEVIQYCVDNDMYVLLNIHWDGGWLENNCTTEKQDENNAKQKAFWEQIATHLRGFDEHLLFASANEPNVDDATKMSVLLSYHQTFINAVRSTGGKNSYRVLVVQGPSTDIEKTHSLMQTLPSDEVENRMMVEIHYYTPWNFCGLTEDADWGSMFYYWGKDYHSQTDAARNATWGEEETVDTNFALMKSQFVDKGIPVIMGEYGPTRRSSLTGDALTLHLASRAYYLEYVTRKAKANGIIPFYWDNGVIDNNGSGLFNRNSNTVFDQQALDAIMNGAAQ